MSRNQILEEVWNAREQMLAECSGDWSRYRDLLRRDREVREARSSEEVADAKAALQTFLDSLPTVDLSDPIVDEVHRVRQQLWDESGGTWKGFIARLKQHETDHPELLVSKTELEARRKQPARPLTKSS